MSEAQIVKQLAEADVLVLRARKAISDLPEAAEIMKCREQRRALAAKLDQVAALADDASAKTEKLHREQAQVQEKIAELQAAIDKNSDFRISESLTRDMQGQVKRQSTLEDEELALMERAQKIEDAMAQVTAAQQQVNAREAALTAAFKEKGGALQAQLTQAQATQQQLLAQLPAALAARYAQLQKEKGGLAACVLEGDTCSACRSALGSTWLKKAKEGPEVAECPSCRRIMAVRLEA